MFTQSASARHSPSSRDVQCLPPACQRLPPASSASGFTSSALRNGSPGTTRRCTRSKLRNDCSSSHVSRPGGNGSRKLLPPPAEWHTTQRAFPGRRCRKIGSTVSRYRSKSSPSSVSPPGTCAAAGPAPIRSAATPAANVPLAVIYSPTGRPGSRAVMFRFGTWPTGITATSLRSATSTTETVFEWALAT